MTATTISSEQTTTGGSVGADTRIMNLVHDALRRDLSRAQVTLSAEPYPAGDQRKALGDHVGWMMSFLHDHHTSEDNGLWPLVRDRRPQAAALLDDMDAAHKDVAVALADVTACASEYAAGAGDDKRSALAAALARLSELLLPHLQREESDTLPLVSQVLSDEEFQAWDREFNVKGKSPLQLADEGHWIIDGLPPQKQRIVTGLVPPLKRFVLIHGFARRYRRRMGLIWGQSGPGQGRRIKRSGRTEVTVDSPRDAVWELVCDVSRIGEWSHECRSARWVADDPGIAPAVGSRFRASNRSGRIHWTRTSEVTQVEPGHLLSWRTLPTALYPDSTQWTISLQPDGNQTRIVQTYRVLRLPAFLDRVFARMIPSHQDRDAELAEDLHRLGAASLVVENQKL